MPAYRFCRSDDVPLLVRAHNECYAVHFPGMPPLTADDFKRGMRELNLWASSCMVAFAGKQPIAVLLAAKRESANWIYRIGVHPDHRRQGHGRHLLDSLGQKLAILGPRRLLAEVPAAQIEARSFFRACGYDEQQTYTDFVLAPGPTTAPAAAELIVPVSPSELADEIDRITGRCWEREPATLTNRSQTFEGVAIPSGDRYAAWALYRDHPVEQVREVIALEAVDSDRAEPLLSLLVKALRGDGRLALHVPRVSADEAVAPLLTGWGFEPGETTIGHATEAASG